MSTGPSPVDCRIDNISDSIVVKKSPKGLISKVISYESRCWCRRSESPQGGFYWSLVADSATAQPCYGRQWACVVVGDVGKVVGKQQLPSLKKPPHCSASIASANASAACFCHPGSTCA